MPAPLRTAVLVTVLAVGLLGCSDDGGSAAPSSSSSSSTRPTTDSTTTTTERDYTATTGPDCTRGTIPEGTPVPAGCDRLYSPFLGPGQDCVQGQSPDCIDPDGDGLFTAILGGGVCLVERKDPDRCRDDDGDGALDEPLTEEESPF